MEIINSIKNVEVSVNKKTVSDQEENGIPMGEVNTDNMLEEGMLENGSRSEEQINMDEIYIDGKGEDVFIDPIMEEGMLKDPYLEAGMSKVKDPLLSSWMFVIGITVLVLVVSAGLGALLARWKIKKGIDLYED